VSPLPTIAACTGIDALSHALETAVSKKRNALSLAFSREAWRLCGTSLPIVLQKGTDIEARAGMLLGAALAGLAIENSMLGAAHAAANPLTAHFHIAHGQAVGLMLPSVIRFNAADPAVARMYDELGEIKAAALAAKVEGILNLAGMPRSLAECGVTRSSIHMLAAEAAKQWTVNFNPRPVTEKDFVGLFDAAFEPRGAGQV
jgi:alcohol dehydrogenase